MERCFFGLIVGAVYFATVFAPAAAPARRSIAHGLTPPLKGTAYTRSAEERV